MAIRYFRGNLSKKGIQSIIDGLDNYKNVVLQSRLEEMTEKLADIGINMAYHYTGQFAGYITFTKKLDKTEYGCTAIMTGLNSKVNENTWYTSDGKQTAEISSILMAEFGSGQFADSTHRGTFPNQTHAFQSIWSYAINPEMTEWRSNKGIVPTMPMHNALIEMQANIRNVALEVFSK